jgi:uncharacterized protein (DUF1800 family)
MHRNNVYAAVFMILAAVLSACGGGADIADQNATPAQPVTTPISTPTNPPNTTPTNPVTPTNPSLPTVSEPTSDITQIAAARFLTQATFGPTLSEIEALTEQGFNDWLDEQIALPMSSHQSRTEFIFSADTKAKAAGAKKPWSGHRYSAWLDIAYHGEDQLRQRVTFALSQLFVVSDKSTLDNEHVALAAYYDGLARHAFGSYRDLLEYVTLSPVMGVYLNMLGNQKPDLANNIRPDENFAREVMQLFTIGLDELNIDGTPKLKNGRPIATYDIADVKAYAHVFTGWHFAGTTAQTWDNWWQNRNFFEPMEIVPKYHANSTEQQLLSNMIVPAGASGEAAMQIALDSLFQHPNVGPFVAKHLIQRLVTSNPSPEYIARVATVFNNNQNGERGQLADVVKAIMLDPEARAESSAQSMYFGKVKEPLISGVQMVRAFGIQTQATLEPQWPEYQHNQAPLSAPSVFNFFASDFSPVGVLSTKNLTAPELQIINDTFIVRNANHAAWWSLWAPKVTELENMDNRSMTIDYSVYTPLLANGPEAFIDFLNLVLLSGSMPEEMKQTLIDYDNATRSWQEDIVRIKELTFLVTSSPQFAVQR